MTQPAASDVVVAGGGIVGAVVALRLAEAGRRVTLVAPRDPAGTATGASGAMLGVLGELSPQDPPIDLELRLAAWQRYPTWAQSVGYSIESGTFIITRPGNARDLDALSTMRDAARKHGLRAELAHPADVPPLAGTAILPSGDLLYLPDEAWVDGPKLLHAVLDAAVRTGRVNLVDDTIERVLHHSDAALGVSLSQGPNIPAEEVILCTGAAVPAVLHASALPETLVPRIVPAKGVGLLLASDAGRPRYRHVLRTPNRHFACGLHLVPRGDGAVYIGSTNSIAAPHADGGAATAGEVNRLLTTALREFTAGLSAWNLSAAMYGFRPLPMDGLPIVGRTTLPGLSVATGTYRNGVLLAPLIADAMRAELDGEPAPTPADISPRRRITPADPETVIRRGLAELIEYWRDEPGARSHDLLGPLVDRLAAMAFATNQDTDDRILSTLHFLRQNGRPEMVPQAVSALLEVGT